MSQLSTMETWAGKVVHKAIEKFVVPALAQRSAIDWEVVVQGALQIAREQFLFSQTREFRQPGVTKGAAGDRYAALVPHELGETVPDSTLQEALGTIETALRNLSDMDELWCELRDRGRYFAELSLSIPYQGVHVEAWVDLLCFRGFGKPIIVDWKVSRSLGGGDAGMQMGLYAWILVNHPNWKVGTPSDVRALEVQLLRNEVVVHECDEERMQLVEDHLYESIDEIGALFGDGNCRSVDINDLGYARNPNNCAMCSYQGICSLRADAARGKERAVQASLF